MKEWLSANPLLAIALTVTISALTTWLVSGVIRTYDRGANADLVAVQSELIVIKSKHDSTSDELGKIKAELATAAAERAAIQSTLKASVEQGNKILDAILSK